MPRPDSQAQVAAAFEAMEASPPSIRLRWLYMATGLLWCVCSVGPMALQETGGIPLAVSFLSSLGVTWMVLKHLRKQILLILLLVWAGWVALSLAWSTDPHKGQWDLASLRFIWFIPALWPLIRDRRLLVAAVAAGFLLGNVSQLVLWAGHHFGIHALAFKEFSPGGRNPGWWTHPAEAGYILVGALGLHLPAALMGRGRVRWVGAGGCAASWLGMIATGTRGAWIAGLSLMVFGAGLALVSGRWKWRSARWGLVGVAAAVAIGWFTVGGFVSRRAGEGISDVRAALAEHRYDTDTGARIKLALMAVEMFEHRPLVGWGAGSYEPHAREVLKSEGADLDWWADRPGSAHNAWLHIAATLGLVGVAIAAGIAWLALRGGFERWREEAGTYALGPGFALVGMLLTTPFDPIYLNSVPSAFLTTMLALCLSGRPRRAGPPG